MISKKMRTKMLDTLNKQRRRLKSKGADNTAIQSYFNGFSPEKRFSSLSDTELYKAYETHLRQPSVEVDKNSGAIVKRGFLKRHKAHYDQSKIKSTPYTLKQSTQSKLMNSSIKKLEKQKLSAQKMSINKYLEQAKKIGVDDRTLGKLKNLSNNEFFNLINSGGGKLDFQTVFMYEADEINNPELYRDQAFSIVNDLKIHVFRSRF